MNLLSTVETAPGALGLWLAEMEFAPPDRVRDAIRDYADDGRFSYPANFDFATDALRRWVARRHGWRTTAARYRWFSGVLHATAATVLAVTAPGAAVAVLTPAYPPMLRAIGELGRRLVRWPLTADDRFDTAGLAELVGRENPSLVVLTTPHNPTGRVFTDQELRSVADVLRGTEVHVLSDEVFADVVYAPARHVPFALAAGADVAARTVTVMSASKAFNLAGLRCAAAIAGSPETANRLGTVPAALTGTTSVVGAIAATAAWEHGEDWLTRTLACLADNRNRLFDALGTEIPSLTGACPQGTYMAWLRATGKLAATGAVHATLLATGVDLAEGTPFGDETGTMARMTFACTPDTLTTAIERLSR
jgi:cystathionine beta-lyase